MQIVLKPEIQRFVEDQVRVGHYPSADAVIEDAMSRLMADHGDGEIDDETFAALQESEDQIRRGEVFTIDEVREHFRRRGVDLPPSHRRTGQDSRPTMSVITTIGQLEALY